jgi:hypothetical protein
MIITQLKGGLGNQLFQYALGRRLAIDRNVPLKLDLSWYSTQSLRSYQLDHFQIEAQIATQQELAAIIKSHWRGLSSRLFHAVQRRLPYYRRTKINEKKISYDPNILKAPRNVVINGYWQSEKYFKPIQDLIRKEFQLKAPLSHSAQSWLEKIKNGASASIHIRRGDYTRNPTHGLLPVEYYRKAAAHIAQISPDTTYYIFSDDMNWAQKHIDFIKRIEFVQVISDQRDEEELILMSQSQHHIIANSSYSWWGAWLGKDQDGIVIAPMNWFNDTSRDIVHRFPPLWIRK